MTATRTRETLVAVADCLNSLRNAGVTRESLEYVADQVFLDPSPKELQIQGLRDRLHAETVRADDREAAEVALSEEALHLKLELRAATEHAEAELHDREIRLDEQRKITIELQAELAQVMQCRDEYGDEIDIANARAERAEAENARLTAQLQAYEAVLSVVKINDEPAIEFVQKRILDAAADGGE